jgi:chemotaxis protein MotB
MPLMVRKKEEEEGASWLTTFGDMITLLFTFFVLVYSFCSFNPGEWETANASIKGALAVIPGTQGDRVVPGGGTGPFPRHLGVVPMFADPTARGEARRKALREELAKIKDAMDGTEGIEIEETPTGYIFRIATPILFEIGKAETKPVADRFLRAIADATHKARGTVLVSGHTCDLPISNSDFQSNWELSARRATDVLRKIKAHAGPDTRFIALARGAHEPIVANDTELCRARNRRVEIRFDLDGGLPFGF